MEAPSTPVHKETVKEAMDEAINRRSVADTGLLCLVTMARFHQMAVDPAQIAHQFGEALGDTEILRAAKALSFKASLVASSIEKLEKTTLPAIAKANDGSYFIIARVSPSSALRAPSPQTGRRKIFPLP